MKPLARIRPRSFLAFGFVASFALVGGQQMPPLAPWTPVDGLMKNAQCKIITTREISGSMYEKAGDNTSLGTSSLEKYRGVFRSLNGQREVYEEHSSFNRTGRAKRTLILRTWNGIKGDKVTQHLLDGKVVEVMKSVDRSFDTTIDPAALAYKLRGFAPKELINRGKAKARMDGNLLFVEGSINEIPFKAWINPNRSDLVERAEFILGNGKVMQRMTIPRARQVNGVWLPETYVVEHFPGETPPLVALTKTTIQFADWSFGTIKTSFLPTRFNY